MNAMPVVTLVLAVALSQAPPVLRIEPDGGPRRVKVIARLPEELRVTLPEGKLTQDQGEQWLSFAVVHMETGKSGPPILGSYERRGEWLTFRPGNLLTPEQTYRAVFRPGAKSERSVVYTVSAPKATPPAVVEKVYPTAKELPANCLRFYIHFSKPMRGGQDLFDQIYLVDDKGNKVHDPWLRDELWDATERMLVLYIHPGRIKWGLLLRLLFGPVFLPNREYTLVIGPEVQDKSGQPLGKEYRFTFRTTAEDRKRLDVSKWKLTTPALGTKEAVTLTVPQALDNGSMKRYLKIVDDKGERVPGRIEVAPGERQWTFHPEQAWRGGTYKLVIDPELEDVAGNTPVTAFDVDADAPKLPPQRLNMEFRPSAKKR